MKLYTREEFLGLPAGVIFAKYEPCCFGAFQIKGDTLQYNDFNYQELVNINSNLWDEYADACLEMEQTKTASVDFYDWCRDGLFEPKQLFAVLDASEVMGLIARLRETLEEGYAPPVF